MIHTQEKQQTSDFYPRPPGGGRPFRPRRWKCCATQFLSTPSGWRATPAFALSVPRCPPISIHALRVEGDVELIKLFQASRYFYPRPPGGGRQSTKSPRQRRRRFLSTPSGWRATIKVINHRIADLISIHALRVEGDLFVKILWLVNNLFLSTPSGWRATRDNYIYRCIVGISIHALRVEGDALPHAAHQLILPYFYPRPPGGGRRDCDTCLYNNPCDFYPRPPGGGRRLLGVPYFSHSEISIHALRVEGDSEASEEFIKLAKFLSTPSGWRATVDFFEKNVAKVISIHALRVEGDIPQQDLYKMVEISIHALRVEGDLSEMSIGFSKFFYFYPRPPGGGRHTVERCRRDKAIFLSTPSGWRATRTRPA